MNWLLNIIGFLLMLTFVSLFIRRAAETLPAAEGYEEEPYESAADDPIRFRVESDEWLPVELERE